jgi:hypothetical protein
MTLQDICVRELGSLLRLRFPFHPLVGEVCFCMQANFKPGAATWNTDDPDQQPWLKHKKPRQGGKKAEEPAEAAPKPKPVPSAYMTTAKLTESVQTTGECPQPST